MVIVLKENTNGEREEEAKFVLTFFANCLKESEEEEPEKLLHFVLRNEFFVVTKKNRFQNNGNS